MTVGFRCQYEGWAAPAPGPHPGCDGGPVSVENLIFRYFASLGGIRQEDGALGARFRGDDGWVRGWGLGCRIEVNVMSGV